jgi:sirohydrochlorin cobaltochelatase
MSPTSTPKTTNSGLIRSTISSAIVLFAHGSRDPLWARPIEEIAQRLSIHTPNIPVSCAYLELMSPSLSQAVESLLSTHGELKCVSIFPVFLGMGRHAREDLPALCQALQAKFPAIEFRQLASAGESPQVLDAIAATAAEAIR